jgi:hypothetical protein
MYSRRQIPLGNCQFVVLCSRGKMGYAFFLSSFMSATTKLATLVLVLEYSTYVRYSITGTSTVLGHDTVLLQ